MGGITLFAFTLNTYKNNIHISEDGANRVQANCEMSSKLMRLYIQMLTNITMSKMENLKMNVSVGSVTNMYHMEKAEV